MDKIHTTNIYTLSDPITNEVRWVGKTSNPKQRLIAHCWDKRKDVYKKWIKSLRENGVFPKLDIVDIVPVDEWDFWERYWISQFKSWGFLLLNKSIGGKGMSGVHIVYSEERRRQMSLSRIGKKPSEEIKKRIAASGIYERARKRMLGDENPGKAQMKPLMQFHINGDFIREWACCAEVEKELGYFKENVSRACRGVRLKTYKGFIWKYK